MAEGEQPEPREQGKQPEILDLKNHAESMTPENKDKLYKTQNN